MWAGFGYRTESERVAFHAEIRRKAELAASLSPDASEILEALWRDDPTGDLEELVQVARRLAA